MKFNDFKPALTVALGVAIFVIVVRQAKNFELTKGLASYLEI